MDATHLLTKSDFLLFLEAPMHLWAKKHGQYKRELSEFEQDLIRQGMEIEPIAKEFVERYMLDMDEGEELIFQQTFENKRFSARTDVLVYKPKTGSYDLYEIKSSSSVKKENISDVAFQYLVVNEFIQIDQVNILFLNKAYVRENEIDLMQLFTFLDVTELVQIISEEIDILRNMAYEIALAETADEIVICKKPKDCPCVHLCHPGLPELSIYDIPRIDKTKLDGLIGLGIKHIQDVPDSYKLSEKQRKFVEIVKANQEYIEIDEIRNIFQSFEYPLYFLDYETYSAAIPLFDGYKPYQHCVFQFSLHILDEAIGEIRHREHLEITRGDPAKGLLEHLVDVIGYSGTVFVWNRGFEESKNKEMAVLYPEYEGLLSNINSRIYDLAEFVSKGHYIHPGFKGKYSIKNVLPVIAPELSYEGLEVGNGTEASTTWWKFVNREFDEDDAERKVMAMKEYCKLDTLAMVKVFEFLYTKIE